MPAAPNTTDPLLDVRDVTKRFPGVRALDGVSLSLAAGEVHGLLGENGAGKSTLLKILSGAQTADSGTLRFAGAPLALTSPHDAQVLGISTIYQEFNLIPDLSVAENVFVGHTPGSRWFVDWRKMRRLCRELLQRLGLDLDPDARVGDLSVAQQQLVEIAKALSMQARLIIMDEPTAALSDAETQQLLDVIRDLKARGIAIVFVTHRLDEAMQVCDAVTILRDGAVVGGGGIAELSVDEVIRTMVGRDVAQHYTPASPRQPGEEVLRVRGLTARSERQGGHAVRLQDIDFSVRQGEVLGIAGLMGSGRTELARCIFGADQFDTGSIELLGEPVVLHSPADAIRHGIGLVPEDRKQQALFLDLAVRHNLTITALGPLLRLRFFVDGSAEDAMIERYKRALNIKMTDPEQAIAKLSGGNQQKVVLSRWLAVEPRVLIVDEPTRGIDVAAKTEVHQHLDAMARSGIAIVVISSELPELLAVSDRIATMCEGRMTGIVDRSEASEEALMRLMAPRSGARAA